jgi:cell division protein FtsL
MRDEALDAPVVLVPKAIDNSHVVREVDPRTRGDLWRLLAVAGILVGGLVLYAWPHFQLRQAGIATEQMQRERERLLEENRKLRLEKATLENLRRVEAIARRDLGLAAPPPERTVVVEKPPRAAPGERLASEQTSGGARN